MSAIRNVILVTGSRHWTNGRAIVDRLRQEPDGTTVIQGGAAGADTFARWAALALGFHEVTVLADWALGRKAGPLRNRAMLRMNPVKVIAFHDNLPASRGTKDCVDEAIRRGIPVEVIPSGEFHRKVGHG